MEEKTFKNNKKLLKFINRHKKDIAYAIINDTTIQYMKIKDIKIIEVLN